MAQWFEAARVGEIADRECKAVSVNGTFPRVGWKGIAPPAPGTCRSSSIRTGEALKAPAYGGVHRFPVRVRDGIVEVCDDRA
jgi:hypothetical protein